MTPVELQLERYTSNEVSTLGKLKIAGVFECYVCEDAYHQVKVFGQTRIPAGRYQVVLKPLGTSRMDHSYSEKFPFHKGMLELVGVPGFAGVLIHIGNKAADTEGCLLLGKATVVTADPKVSLQVTDSKIAYEHFYPKVLAELAKSNPVYITVTDGDRLGH